MEAIDIQRLQSVARWDAQAETKALPASWTPLYKMSSYKQKAYTDTNIKAEYRTPATTPPRILVDYELGLPDWMTRFWTARTTPCLITLEVEVWAPTGFWTSSTYAPAVTVDFSPFLMEFIYRVLASGRILSTDAYDRARYLVMAMGKWAASSIKAPKAKMSMVCNTNQTLQSGDDQLLTTIRFMVSAQTGSDSIAAGGFALEKTLQRVGLPPEDCWEPEDTDPPEEAYPERGRRLEIRPLPSGDMDWEQVLYF